MVKQTKVTPIHNYWVSETVSVSGYHPENAVISLINMYRNSLLRASECFAGEKSIVIGAHFHSTSTLSGYYFSLVAIEALHQTGLSVDIDQYFDA